MIKIHSRRIILLGILLALLAISLVLIGKAVANLPAQEMGLNYNGAPYEIHADASGNLWVTDYLAGELWWVNAAGTSYKVYSVGGISPSDANPDNAGYVWWVDGTSLSRLNLSTNAITTWNIKIASYLVGLGFDTTGKPWITDGSTPTVYSFDASTKDACPYTVPNTADFYYPLVSGTQLWIGDVFNGRLVRLDFSATPTWMWWQLPAGSSPYYLASDGSGNIWYTDQGNAALGELNPSTNQLWVYPMPLGTNPSMLATSAGKVWYTEQSLASIGLLDPSVAPPSPTTITHGTLTTSTTCTRLNNPSSTSVTPTGDMTPSWSPYSYATLYNANGWQIYQLPPSSQPNGIALTSNGFAVDSLRSVLIRFAIAPLTRLVVVKHVINDNGGTSVASNFTMNVTANNPSQSSFAGAESPGNEVYVDPGPYSVSETGLSGYTASPSADCSGTIALGQTKTCTITNDDNPPALHLRKTVTNDNGGTAFPTAWTLSAAGPTPLSGTTPVDSAATFSAGTYTLSESGGPSGYTPSAWSCVKNGGAPVNGSSINLALGDNATCTINNNDNAPNTSTLVVIKHVVNTNGGTAVAANFTINVTATNPSQASFNGAESPGTSVSVDPGTYSIAETPKSGYASSYSSDCSGTIAAGQTKTCTITNQDIAPSLKLVKNVINDDGGHNVPADWTLTAATSAVGYTDRNYSHPGDYASFQPIYANKAYTLAESVVPGYTSGTWSCDHGVSVVAGVITLPEGLTQVTCTITNDDNKPNKFYIYLPFIRK